MGGSSGSMGGSAHQLNHKAVMVTPTGSLLAVNQPLELRESTLTVGYPGTYCTYSTLDACIPALVYDLYRQVYSFFLWGKGDWMDTRFYGF